MTTESEKIETIKEFRKEGNKVIAVFYHKDYVNEYINKHSSMKNGKNWYDKIAFADFKKGEDPATIEAYSTYHSSNSLISMFENGLRNK
jgi:ABC-type phosphate/phosphonate transport system ATPase subunit